MRNLERNKRRFYYALYKGCVCLKDEYGNLTGEVKTEYSDPVSAEGNISAAAGAAQTEQFGTLLSYDKVIIIDDMECPIDENSILFIDSAPAYDSDNNPGYDYVVIRVSKSFNCISYAISRVSVS